MSLETRHVFEHAKHFTCKGYGVRQRKEDGRGPSHEPCKGCGGTGEAGVAFARALLRRWPGLEGDYTFDNDEDFDTMLECYVAVLYGKPGPFLASTSEARAKGAHAYTVLQHAVNREAARAVVRLGGADRLWNWLRGEARRVLRGTNAGGFTW